MQRKFRLRKKEQFQKIIKSRKNISTKSFILYYSLNAKGYVQIGISVPKKVGNAVFRNRIKRQIRSILQQTLDTNLSYNLILIARKFFFNLSFEEKKYEVDKILKKFRKVNK